MTTSNQQKSKSPTYTAPTYTGLETEEPFGIDPVVPRSPQIITDSSTPLVIVIVLAAFALAAYFMYASGGKPVTTNVTPPVATENVTPAPVPSDPVPAKPVPPTPPLADPVPAPAAPAN